MGQLVLLISMAPALSATAKTSAQLQAPEEVPPASLDSGGDSYGSEDAHSLDSGGALVVDPVEAPLRYEVDPDILAEIEASGITGFHYAGESGRSCAVLFETRTSPK